MQKLTRINSHAMTWNHASITSELIILSLHFFIINSQYRVTSNNSEFCSILVEITAKQLRIHSLSFDAAQALISRQMPMLDITFTVT